MSGRVSLVRALWDRAGSWRRVPAGVFAMAAVVVVSGCVTAPGPSRRVMDLNQVPSATVVPVTQPAKPYFVPEAAPQDTSMRRAREESTAGVAPGRVAGGTPEPLTVRAPQQGPESRRPLPPPPIVSTVPKPPLTSPALPKNAPAESR